jgi:type I restriction enzyme S subunit
MFENSPTRIVDEVCESFKIGPFGSALHKNEMSTQGYAFVLGTDNAVKNEFAYKEIRYINQEKYNELSKYKVEPKEIIMSMMGTVGRVALIPENIGTAIISSHLCILRINPKIMHPEFFHLAFSKDDEIQFQIDGIHNGSIMKGFNLKIVKAFKIKCPDIQEQNNFISFAKQIDKSKFAVQKSLEKAETLYKSLMQEYFG